jgi:hypothetical protein
MVEMGYSNVWIVEGGGKAMEKYFDHYAGRYFVSPSKNTKKLIKPFEKKSRY